MVGRSIREMMASVQLAVLAFGRCEQAWSCGKDNSQDG
jgi:hypothetical protein